jgi:hypothetical protein
MGANEYWLSDAPPDITVPGTDAFDVERHVRRLAELIEAADPPFTLSLSGDWGIGKTTLANAVMNVYGGSSGYVDVWSADVANLRRAIAIEVGAAARGGTPDDRLAVASEIDNALRETLSTELPPEASLVAKWQPKASVIGMAFAGLAFIALLTWWIAKQSLPAPGTPVDATQALAAVLDDLAPLIVAVLAGVSLANFGLSVAPEGRSVSVAPATESVKLGELFRQYVTITQDGPPKPPILIVIDNLDRLRPTDALRALGEIRDLVEVKGSRCVFLVPVDREALIRGLTAQVGGDSEGARDYLEKFFNLDLAIARPASVDLRRWALSLIKGLFPDEPSTIRVEVAQIVASASSSPRTVKRLLNGISTRRQLLELDKAQITVTQLAFAEGLNEQFSGLAGELASRPRLLEQLLSAVDEKGTLEERAATISNELRQMGLSAGESERVAPQVAQYLARNSDVKIDAGTLSLALALRVDRLWAGLSNGAEIRNALNAGFEADFAGLVSRSGVLAEEVIDRSLQYLSTYASEFPRDILNGVLAMGPTIAASYQERKSEWQKIARTAILTDPSLLASLSDAAIDQLFGGLLRADGETKRIVSHAISQIAEPAATIRPQLQLLGCMSSVLDATSLSSAHKELAALPIEALGPLFEPQPRLPLVGRPVLQKLFESISGWTIGGDQEPALRAGQWALALPSPSVSIFSDDWGTPDALATVVDGLIRATAPGEPDLPVLELIVRILGKQPPSSALDQLASRLAEPIDSNPATFGALLRLALVLPVQQVALAPLLSRITESLPSLREDGVRTLLGDDASHLDAKGISFRAPLRARWVNGEGEPFAAMSVVGSRPAETDLVHELRAAPARSVMRLASQASNIVAASRNRAAMSLVMETLADRVPDIPAKELGHAVPTLVSARRLRVKSATLVDALETRARRGKTDDLEALAQVGAAMATEHLAGARKIEDAVAESRRAPRQTPAELFSMVLGLDPQRAAEELLAAFQGTGISARSLGELRSLLGSADSRDVARIVDTLEGMASDPSRSNDVLRVIDTLREHVPPASPAKLSATNRAASK